MKVLVVENEHYLAQSIMAKLIDKNYVCEAAKTKEEAISHEDVDVVVLSTNISEQNFMPVVEHFSGKIIILMVSYINNDTVIEPLKRGACDYVLKPIMVEELIRKIEHFHSYNKLKKEHSSMTKYMRYLLQEENVFSIEQSLPLPLAIHTDMQEKADYYAIELARKKNLHIEFVDLKKQKLKDPSSYDKKNMIYYLYNLEHIKQAQVKRLLEALSHSKVIFSFFELNKKLPIKTIELKNALSSYEGGEFLSIQDYIKHVITTHQAHQSDTKLAQKLGISRKSLWEKRKRYGIARDKRAHS